jgi:predicted phosphodiesterase
MFQRSQTMQGAVWIGKDPLYLNTTILAKGSLRYNVTIKPAKKNKAKPFIYWSEYYHHVVVDNLLPNTIYYYQCILIDQSTNSFAKNRTNGLVKMNPLNHSLTDKPNLEETVRKRHLKDSNNIHSFRTAPKPGTGARTKVAIIADVGVFQHSKDTLSYMGKEMDSLNAIFLLGDISYANSDHRIWDDWFTMMDGQSFLRSKPIYIVAGNHDTEGNLETGELFTAFETRFLMPQLAPAMLGRVSKPRDTDLNLMYKLPYDYGNSYYSFIYGSSHNIVLNSYTDFEPNSRQYKWLVDELTMKVNRTMTPWLVVMMHCPMYNTFSFHQGDPQPLNARRYLEPLFVQHRVNVVLSGHLHAYMRSKPVINETVGPTGPVHIIVGMSGRQANIPYKNAVPEEWVAVRDHQW